MTEYPPILSGTALQQIAALRDYLVRRARDSDASVGAGALDGPKNSASVGEGLSALYGRRDAPPAVGQAAVSAGGASPAPTAAHSESQIPNSALPAAALRALIVKTADRVERQVELLSRSLHEDYLARSDFGDYQEQIDALIRATARQIVESYDFTARLSAADARLGELAGALTRLRGELRRGLIRDPETGELCFGIAIAQELRFTGQTVTEDGLVYEELAPGQTLGLYTASGWQFWINGSKRGWFDASDGQLHIRSLTAEQELRLGGDWLCTPSGGFGIRYVGI
jgi:hypothetical protein